MTASVLTSTAFISYSRRDRDFVAHLTEALKTHEREVWVDWQDIPLTADWWAEICAGIEAANDFIFVISPDSVRSDVCRREIEHATEHHKRIVPIAYRPITEADDRGLMHPAVNAHQWIQFRPEGDFEAAFGALLAALDTDLSYIREHTRLLVRARNWEHRLRDPSHLLRGGDLDQAEAWLRGGQSKTKTPPTDLHREYITTSRRVERRRQRVARAVVAASAVILGLALLASYLAWLSNERRQQASDAQDRAEAISWAAQAQIEVEGYAPERGVLLALASLDRSPTWQAERALALAVQNSPARALMTGHQGTINAAAWSPDGARLVTASSDFTAQEWDVASGQPLVTLSGLTDTVTSVAWSPDGTRILAGGEDGRAIIWDAASGQPVLTLEPEWDVTAVAWSPDGERVLTGHGPDLAAVIWDAASGQPLVQLEGHAEALVSAAWSLDGTQVMTASGDGLIMLWNPADGTPQRLLATAQVLADTRLNEAAWSPDGARIASAHTDSSARVWQVAAFDPAEAASRSAAVDDGSGSGAASGSAAVLSLTLNGHVSNVWSVAWSPDGTRLATASADRSAMLWDTSSGALLRTLNGHSSEVSGVVWSPDGSLVATTSRDRTARAWDATTFPIVAVLREHTGWVLEAGWSPDGSQIVTAGRDKTARVWEAASGRVRLVLTGHTNQVRSAAWSPDGAHIATGGADSTVRVWDAVTGQPVALIPAHSGTIVSLTWSPDSARLATTSTDGLVKLWSVAAVEAAAAAASTPGGYGAEMQPDATISGHADWINQVAWSPDGSRLVTASRDNTAMIWDGTTGAVLVTLIGHSDWVNSAAWSPDGTRVATASVDDTAKIWDAASGALLFTLGGHRERVLGVAWSPEGTRVVTASEDRTVKVWDAENGVELMTLSGHTGRVYTASWSPDGTRIVTASADGTARIWTAWETMPDLVQFAEQCCAIRVLTPAERAQFDLPEEND